MTRYGLAVPAMLALLAAADGRSAWGHDQTLLGFRALVIDPKPADPSRRKVRFDVREGRTTDVLEGDPSVTGGVLRIEVDGTTPSSQTLCLPPGGAWIPSQNGFRYTGGALDPVRFFKLRRTPRDTPQGLVRMFGILLGRRGPVSIVPPNTLGPEGMRVTFTIGEALGACTAATAHRYCTAYGGAAGGVILADDAKRLRVRFPTAEVSCPAGSPSGAFLEGDAR